MNTLSFQIVSVVIEILRITNALLVLPLSGNEITQRSLCKELQNNSSMSLHKDCLEREICLFKLHSVMLASNESA